MADIKTVVEGLQKVSGYFKSMLKVGCDGDSDIYTQHREAVKKAIELLKEHEAMHWVSVNDRLPTYAELKADSVLALLDDGTVCSTGFDECIENASTFGEWRQNFDPVTLGATDSYWMPLEGVTHWMPIPKLTQEGR